MTLSRLKVRREFAAIPSACGGTKPELRTHCGIVSNNGEIALALAQSSSIRRSGVPTAMNPPIMRVAPSGIIATAS
jgi:hypothetical protein